MTNRFPTGDPFWYDLQAGADVIAYRWMALDETWIPNPLADVTVADIVAAELGTAGRIALTGGLITTDLPNIQTHFTSDDPDFGTPAGPGTAHHVVLYADVDSTDANAILMMEFPVFRELDGTSWVPHVNAQGLALDRNP